MTQDDEQDGQGKTDYGDVDALAAVVDDIINELVQPASEDDDEEE